MIKSLRIEGESVRILRGERTLEINGKGLEEILVEALPEEVEKYKDCLADMLISIKIYTGGELVTSTNYSQEE